MFSPFDGGKHQEITKSVDWRGPNAFQPVFSPEGDRIAYITDGDENGLGQFTRVVIQDLQSGELKEVARLDSANISALEWSPDGKHLSFLRFRGIENAGLFTVTAEGGGPREIATTATNPAWTPDGKYLTFIRGDIDREKSLIWVTPDGSQEIVTLKDMGKHGFVSERHRNAMTWAGDGSKLLTFGESKSLILVSSDGSTARRVDETDSLEFELQAAWAPDSERLAIVAVPTRKELLAAGEGSTILLIADTRTSNIEVLVALRQGGDDQDLYATVEKQLTDASISLNLEWPTSVTPSESADSVASGAEKVLKNLVNLSGDIVPPFEEMKDSAARGEACSSNDGVCNPRDVSRIDPTMLGAVGASSPPIALPTIEEVLDRGFLLAGASPIHLVAMGSISKDSIRCGWRANALTLQQREQSIRFCMNLEEGAGLPSGTEIQTFFDDLASKAREDRRYIVAAQYQELVDGGPSPDRAVLVCYGQLASATYPLGAGPVEITIAFETFQEGRSYVLYEKAYTAGELGPPETTSKMSRGEHQEFLNGFVRQSEQAIAEAVGGRETLVFLAPMGSHHAIGVEAWQAVAEWDLQAEEDDDGNGGTATTIYAVRYGAPEGDPEYRQTLETLETRITAAAATDAHAGSRIANVNGLEAYYREIGAYGDITPGDGSTATFTPAQPPAPYACAGAAVITDSGTKQGLVHDCEELLSAKDALRGTAALNWATTQALSSWEGVTTTGTPERVTGLDLSGESLSGTIPASLGSLFELTELDLSGNSLTGSIPEELGWLHNLDTLRLSGNSLTGCIPLALKDVATNDLSSLNLLYCQPETPTGVTAGTAAEFSVPVSWTAVENAAKYEVQYRQRRFGEWTNHATQPTGASQTVDGLECEVEYQFRVRAFGSGTTYAADWSDTSIPVVATTGECVSPVFGQAAYEWEAYEDGAAGEALGTAEATDPNEDAVTYSITAGNSGGDFQIDTGTGQVTLAKNVDSALGTVFFLTISASDGTNTGTATVTVSIAASPACGAGLAAPSASSDPGLVTDCQALLEARETLEGTRQVNWSTRRPLAQWQGVTVSGTPQRVTALDLSSSSLDGTVPASLGRLSALASLDLGVIPLPAPYPPSWGT